MFTESDRAIAPGARVGPFRVLRRLAVGGMAELFLAHAVGPAGVERLVVLKQILPGLAEDAEFVEMFLNEARLASVLSHPNVVQILGVGTAAGAYFMVMEYVHGRNVSAILREGSRRGDLPLDCALQIVGAVASATHYAHNCTDPHGRLLGIVHRDVTPSNVLVSSEGAVKLTDFGIAKAVAQSSRTRASAMKGKVGYMAPEQARSQHVDARTDVFALGVLLYELTTRVRCFAGDSDYVTLNRIVEGVYQRPTEVVPGYPAELERIVRTALQPNPDDRYPTAADMQTALAAFGDAQALRPSAEALARYVEELTGFPPHPSVDPATMIAPGSAGLDAQTAALPATPAPRRGWPGWAIAASALGGAGIAAAIALSVPAATETPVSESAEVRSLAGPAEAPNTVPDVPAPRTVESEPPNPTPSVEPTEEPREPASDLAEVVTPPAEKASVPAAPRKAEKRARPRAKKARPSRAGSEKPVSLFPP